MCEVSESCKDCPIIDELKSMMSRVSVLLNSITIYSKPSVCHSDVKGQTNSGSIPEVVQWFIDECLGYGLQFNHLISDYDIDRLTEKAIFYKQNLMTIQSKKGYLMKIISDLPLKPRTKENEKSLSDLTKDRQKTAEYEDREKTERRHKELDPLLGRITDKMIEDRLSGNAFLKNYCKSVSNVRASSILLYAIADILHKDGTI